MTIKIQFMVDWKDKKRGEVVEMHPDYAYDLVGKNIAQVYQEPIPTPVPPKKEVKKDVEKPPVNKMVESAPKKKDNKKEV